MEPLTLGLFSLPILLALIFLRIPIGLSMLALGLVGSWMIFGSTQPLRIQMQTMAYGQFANHSLSIIPLFLLMGQFAAVSGMSTSIFRAAEALVGHHKGGMAMAAVGSCAGFGAICGSSMATAATMSQVALPELRRAGYADSISVGTLAAGGTLGILIPPSIVLVVYAILAEQNIVKMFAAAFIPGVLAAVGYMLVVAIMVRIHPSLVTKAMERMPWPARIKALCNAWPVALVFSLVLGGIYTGVFTPTEAAAVGTAMTAILAWRQGSLNRQTLRKILENTAGSTAMLFMILLGASAYNNFLALSTLPQELATWVGTLGLSPFAVLWAILIFYLLMGCVMDAMSIILLTIPVFFPLISGMDFGLGMEETAIWFGILVLVVTEVGLITPPVGMNLFVIHSMSPGIKIREAYMGVFPFVLSDLVRILALVMFPALCLALVRMFWTP